MTKSDEQPIEKKSNEQINRLSEYIIEQNSALAQDMFDFLAVSQEFSDEQVDAFLKKVQATSKKFRAKIVELNAGLVRSYVGQFTKLATPEQIEDYNAVGVAALYEAMGTYDSSKGTFSHWAYQAIRREVLLEVRKNEHTGLSSRDFDKRRAVKSAEEKLLQEAEGKPVSIGEVAAQAHVSEDQAKRILEARSNESLDAPLGYEAFEAQGSGYFDEPTADEEIAADAWQEEVNQVLREAHPREVAVFLLRMGLGGYPSASYDDIADMLDLSRETVRKADIRIRENFRAKGLDPSLLSE